MSIPGIASEALIYHHVTEIHLHKEPEQLVSFAFS